MKSTLKKNNRKKRKKKINKEKLIKWSLSVIKIISLFTNYVIFVLFSEKLNLRVWGKYRKEVVNGSTRFWGRRG